MPIPPRAARQAPFRRRQRDRHRLLSGDALDPASYQQFLGTKRAQLAFTDPPYNVPIDCHACGLGKVRHADFAMASGEMSAEAFTAYLRQVLALHVAHSCDGALHYVCMDWRHMAELLAAGSGLYSELKNLCVWAKDNGGMGSLYRSQHELVFVHKAGTSPHTNNVELGRYGRNRSNVWSYPCRWRRTASPTPSPGSTGRCSTAYHHRDQTGDPDRNHGTITSSNPLLLRGTHEQPIERWARLKAPVADTHWSHRIEPQLAMAQAILRTIADHLCQCLGPSPAAFAPGEARQLIDRNRQQ